MYKSMQVLYGSYQILSIFEKSLILCFFEYTVQYTNHKCFIYFIFQFGLHTIAKWQFRSLMVL